MNLYDNIPNFNGPIQQQTPLPMLNNTQLNNNNLYYKINELEQRLKKIEQRLSLLEANTTNNNYQEPDTSLYMI